MPSLLLRVNVRNLRRRCRSQIHPLIRRSSFNSPIMSKSPDRIAQLGRRMSCNQLILAIDPPGSIEQLADFDLRLSVRALVGTRRKIQDQPSNPNAVIIPHHRAIAKADEAIQIQLPGNPPRHAFWDSLGETANRRLNRGRNSLRKRLAISIV